MSKKKKEVCGRYGVCIDDSMGADEFEYMIADNYDPVKELPDVSKKFFRVAAELQGL